MEGGVMTRLAEIQKLFKYEPIDFVKSPTMLELCGMADRKFTEMNLDFLDLVKDGLTTEELRTLIARRPEVYERFSGWIPVLGGIIEAMVEFKKENEHEQRIPELPPAYPRAD
jgi:hypothetical protein